MKTKKFNFVILGGGRWAKVLISELDLLLNTAQKVIIVSSYNQKELIEFIEYFKTYEDKNGYIKNNFLNILHDKNYKFTSGPFVNLMFKLIKKNKKNLKILVGNVKTVLNVNSNYHYQLN